MLKHAPLFAFLLLAAGCAQEHASTSQQARAPAASAPVAARAAAGLLASPQSPSQALATGHTFASQPDRGDLVAYPATPVVRRDGAYTWHRADLSEAHAIRAIATGLLHVRAPSGEDLTFRYDRHEEYPNGDWTWVGHLVDGTRVDDVVITFGAKAAFGTIAQPGKAPLRLTIQNGQSWLVETDRAAIARIHNAATDPTGPDYLLVPRAAAATAAGAATPATAAAAPVAAAATTAANPTVDLVLGYTTGFASALGGQSQANTRLTNMVAITNEAYANSQVPGRVRLVGTVQVSYPDNTDNSDALEKLTGYRHLTPTTGEKTTPDAAFGTLRAARDRYGADLVSLVRRFNDPENDGCGIAWLIGGNDTGTGLIHASDEYFGYSVVSDGSDGGYYCREETLAHELGHSMGAQHDRATATENGKLSYGIYPYSFGYKTGAGAGNFYTIMAYGDKGQASYPTFSNPRITLCGGYACGVADQADVARSLTQTMPAVASFRATVVASMPARARSDMDGDGKSDLLWRNPASSDFAYWLMSGGQTVRTMTTTSRASASYWVAASGDFNGDGRVDALWTSSARDLWMWTGTGSDFGATYMGTYPDGWVPVGGGDVNGDGLDDLLWRHPASSQFAYWLLNGTTVLKTVTANARASAAYRVAAVGDFNGDGRADLVWTSDARDLWLWTGDGTGFSAVSLGSYPAGWTPAGAGDINSDLKSDLLWRNSTQGSFAYWLMDGATVLRTATVGARASSTYYIAAIGDYNGDGAADVVWTSPSRDVWVWTWTGADFNATYAGGYPAGWEIVGK